MQSNSVRSHPGLTHVQDQHHRKELKRALCDLLLHEDGVA